MKKNKEKDKMEEDRMLHFILRNYNIIIFIIFIIIFSVFLDKSTQVKINETTKCYDVHDQEIIGIECIKEGCGIIERNIFNVEECKYLMDKNKS